MRINPSVFTNEVFFFIQKKLDLSTITQNKRILAIFLASVTCLAVALYTIKRYYFNAEVVNQKKELVQQAPEKQEENKIIKKEYPGMVVEAPMKEEKFNGKGTLLFSDGTKCEVEFENNKLNKGELTYPSGDKASIYFEDVLLNDNGSLMGKISLNFGKQIEPEKIKFGNFSGMAHIEMWAGHGNYEFLEGEFKEGQFNGKSLGKACMGCGMG